MDFLSAVLFRIFVFIMGLIPFRVLYLFSDFVAFILFKVVGYRKQVVYDNLRLAFPEKSEEEIDTIARLSYKNLADITVEGIKVFTMSTDALLKRFKIKNREAVDRYDDRKQSLMLLAAHYCNWEWGAVVARIHLGRKLIGLYKPLTNKYIDRYLRENRRREGTILASIYETAKSFMENVDTGALFVLIADQSPSNLKRARFVDFFGVNTPFLHGPENYARKYSLPVFFIEERRIKRGYYEYELQLIVDRPEELPENEITRRYAQKLESVIRKQPENWLWSHRRWKHVIKNKG